MRPLPVLVFLTACAGKSETSDHPGDETPTDPHTQITPTNTGSTGTLTEGPCPAVSDVSSEQGALPQEQRIAVTLDSEGTVWATCTSPDDADELHLVESKTPATDHELVLRGLLADTAYTCQVHAACGGPSKSVDFTSGSIPKALPELTVSGDPKAGMSGAYTLFNSQGGGCGGADVYVAIADPQGRIRWAYDVGSDLVSDIDAYLIDANTIHMGGGWGLFDEGAPNRGVFRTMDLSGNVQIERTTPDFGLGFNHHSEPLADGTFLSITGDYDSQGGRQWHGVGVEQWSPTDGVVWSWDSQALVDSGFIDPPPVWNDNEAYHANAVSFLTDSLGDAMWLSDFGMQQIWRIDRGTGELTHVFAAGGDFDLVDAQGNHLSDNEFPQVQHGVDYKDDKILLYDNGQQRGYSRVSEYQVDLAGLQAKLLWTWSDDTHWYDPILGDADYLPNGDVLVAKGFSKCFTPFSNDTSEVLELVPPDKVVWRMKFPDSGYTMYRAQRYDGCDVFGNARYCQAVADRIDELTAQAER